MANPSSVAQLPPEIYEDIFDSIEDHEFYALQSASLTCHAFRDFCQRRLFRRVAVSLKEPCTAPSRLYAAISRSPHIHRSIRELSIAIKPGLSMDPNLEQEEGSVARLIDLLLPHLTTLRLLGTGTSAWSSARWDWANIPSGLKTSLLRALSSTVLEAVELHGGAIPTSALCSFSPKMKRVGLINMFINTDPWAIPIGTGDAPVTLPAIESLAVRDLFLHPSLTPECVFGPETVINTTALKVLKISLGPGGDIDETQVLETSHQSVEHLTIYDNFVSSSRACVLAPGCDIDAWASLKTLTLYISLSNHSPTLVYPRLLNYLQHMKPPPQLSRVNVNFIANSPTQFEEWAQCHLPVFDAAMTKALPDTWSPLRQLRMQVLTKEIGTPAPFPLAHAPALVETGIVTSRYSQQLHPSEFPHDTTTSSTVHF